MTSTKPFPTKPAPELKLEDIVGYLSECQSGGWKVFVDDEDRRWPDNPTHRFSLSFSELVWIRVHFGNGKCSLWVHRQANEIPIGSPETMQGLNQLVAYGAKNYGGIEWPSSPSTIRLSKATPASNYSAVAGLVGAATVECIFDPYFDDKALANLTAFMNLGVRLSAKCRVLTSAKGAAKLSSSFVAAWRVETGSAAEIRKIASSGHRRFMLLSDDQTLILGLSLNALDKDEAAHLERETEDLAFFDTEWAAATAL